MMMEPKSVATRRSLEQLQSLSITFCDKIEQVLLNEMESNTDASIIEFPNLKELELFDLPNLAAFSQGVESIEFPKLEKMTIGHLPRLNSVLPSDYNAKVAFPGLKMLCLFELPDTISKIWCRHVPINFFHNLETLYIVGFNGISYLISSSIAQNLVNLKCLYIEKCQDMVDVIEDEKEAFAMTLFRNLGELSIETLHKLRSFCQWKHALELPSLKEVKIVDCPGMETFTLGSLRTPYLSRFSIDDTEVETKDLNGAMRYQFRIKIEDEDENKDEDDEHENSLRIRKKQKMRKRWRVARANFYRKGGQRRKFVWR